MTKKIVISCNITWLQVTLIMIVFFFLIKNIVKSFGVVKLKQENLKEESEYRTEACLKIIYI